MKNTGPSNQEQIEELKALIAFHKKRMGDAFDPQLWKKLGDDYYKLASLHRDEGETKACEAAAMEAVRYYQEICDDSETADALWDLDFSWIMLRDLYRENHWMEKAIPAAEKSAALFLRITYLNDGDVYFKNYQISTKILVNLLYPGALSEERRAYELCTECIRNLSERWPEDRGGMRFARIGEMYRQMAEVCGGLRRREVPPQKDWFHEMLDAIDRADAMFLRAMEVSPGNTEVAEYALQAYDEWRTQFDSAPERKRRYVKTEFECLRVLFSANPVRQARNFFLIAWLYAADCGAVLSVPEKRALCEETARELHVVHFSMRGENTLEEMMMKCCYYLGKLHRTCFPEEKKAYYSWFLQSCEYGITAITEKRTYDDSRYFQFALEELIECDEMPYEERPAFAARAKEIFRGNLFIKRDSERMIAALEAFAEEPAAYFDPDDDDD